MNQIDSITIALCGPGDVAREIEMAREAVDGWNEANVGTLGCRLKPVHWITDAVPSMEARGQAVINRDLIDDADILVAVFWRRLGTPTGLHESGTVEEINRALARGRHVLLYFSDLEAPGSTFDEGQYDKLLNFRGKANESGLPWSFRSRAEFKRLFKDHLNKRISSMLAERAEPSESPPTIRQSASGSANVQVAGDNNRVEVKSIGSKRPKVVVEAPPGCISPAEQKEVHGWIDKISILIEKVDGHPHGRAKGEAWSRLHNQFSVASYQMLRSEQIPEVKAWCETVVGQLRSKARRKAPGVHKASRIRAIKAGMSTMGRRKEDYYPELADRLEIRRFKSIKELSSKNLERVYRAVKYDLKKNT